MTSGMTASTFWILTALAHERRHGYAILRDVEALSDGEVQLRVTTLYAALERLVRDGLVVEAGEEIVDGRARRYYVLSDSGDEMLRRETEALERRLHAARARLRTRRAPGEALA